MSQLSGASQASAPCPVVLESGSQLAFLGSSLIPVTPVKSARSTIVQGVEMI